MKNLVILFLILFCSTSIYCQSNLFSEDKVDDMTGKTVRRTEWLTLKTEMSKTYYARFCQVDSFLYLDLKVITGFVTSIPKDADLIIKFSDESTITLKNLEYLISGVGDGATGFIGSKAIGVNPKYKLFKKQIETFDSKTDY